MEIHSRMNWRTHRNIYVPSQRARIQPIFKYEHKQRNKLVDKIKLVLSVKNFDTTTANLEGDGEEGKSDHLYRLQSDTASAGGTPIYAALGDERLAIGKHDRATQAPPERRDTVRSGRSMN